MTAPPLRASIRSHTHPPFFPSVVVIQMAFAGIVGFLGALAAVHDEYKGLKTDIHNVKNEVGNVSKKLEMLAEKQGKDMKPKVAAME